MIKKFALNLFSLFIGFSIGRIGHIFGGLTISPHHWIYGLLMIIVAWLLRKKFPKLYFLVIFFGIGMFISDLNDFLLLRFYGADTVKKFTFWNIN